VLAVRTAVPADAPGVEAVCRATALAGDPVPESDPTAALVCAVYAEPYLALEPSSARLLVDAADTVVGYVVAAVDSVEFYRRWRRHWSARFSAPAGPVPAQVGQLHELLAHPERMLPTPGTLTAYPSHLHLDLLPAARGGGWGTRLLAAALSGLAAAGSPGVHLGVDTQNVRALRFYQRHGFVPSGRDGDNQTLVLVRACSPLPATAADAPG
jgi:ribosomal protein S18 acetylase RimI-like enzyme